MKAKPRKTRLAENLPFPLSDEGMRRFTASERHDLVRAGVTVDQLTGLENVIQVLPRYKTETIRKTEVRRSVQAVAGPLAKALKALDELERRLGAGDARLEDWTAFRYINQVGNEPHIGALRVLVDQLQAADADIASIPQSRRRAAPEPIHHIVDVLRWPSSDIKVTGRFLRVAVACYAAAGISEDPRRAIQSYLDTKRRGHGFITLVVPREAPNTEKPKT